VTLTPYLLLVPWSWKSRAIPLLPLWVVWPVQSLSACTRVHFTFFLLEVTLWFLSVFNLITYIYIFIYLFWYRSKLCSLNFTIAKPSATWVFELLDVWLVSDAFVLPFCFSTCPSNYAELVSKLGEPDHVLSPPVTGCFQGGPTTWCTPQAAVGPLFLIFLSFMFGRGDGSNRWAENCTHFWLGIQLIP